MAYTYTELAAMARPNVGTLCKACPVCDGRGCRNNMPGPGAKGSGTGAIRNYQAWQNVFVNMDTLCGFIEADTSTEIFGKEFSLPLFIAPVGDVNLHYGECMNTLDYNRMSLRAAKDEGIASLCGDGVKFELFADSCKAIAEVDGVGIPTIKPWAEADIEKRLEKVAESGAFAVGMDIDAAGLPFLKGFQPPAGGKTVDQVKIIREKANAPFFLKGIMTPKAALKAVEAGCAGIVVSNHGGRVLDGSPATADVLPSIVEAVDGRCKVFVDGGIRGGLDIFRALALGADAVMACRPFVIAGYGAGEEGIRNLIQQWKKELADTMEMCGCATISDITRDCVFMK